MSQLELAFIILGTILIIMSSLQIAKEHKTIFCEIRE